MIRKSSIKGSFGAVTNRRELAVYVPTWLGDSECDRLSASLPPGVVTRLIVSFAVPKADGTVVAPPISAACARMVQSVGAGAKVSLAIGGYGSDEADHRQILDNFAAAARQPDIFAASAKAAMDAVGAELGSLVTGIDIDWEFPAQSQASDLEKIVSSLRSGLPAAWITMAVPAEGLQFDPSPLVKYIDSFEVMTYDYAGAWSDKTGGIAPARWTINCITHWIAAVGDPAKIVVGYPAYGYAYQGSTSCGEPFTASGVTTVLLKDIPSDAIHDTGSADGANEAQTAGGWTSLVSPAQMARTQQELRHTHPNIGGAMVWSLEGIIPDVFIALS